MQNQKRVVIDAVSPKINDGEFYIKRVVNQIVTVNADVLGDGHDIIAASVLYKSEKDKKWSEVRMQPINNDEWTASFVVKKQGFYEYKVEGWVDYALNWQHGITRKIEDFQKVQSELLEGIEYLNAIVDNVSEAEKTYVVKLMQLFSDEQLYKEAIIEAQSRKLHSIFSKYPKKKLANSSKTYQVYVDRLKAQFSTWYEFFPRSASEKEGDHGTFKDCEKLLPRVAEMGFDTLYFPPIHPIGEVNRTDRKSTRLNSSHT